MWSIPTLVVTLPILVAILVVFTLNCIFRNRVRTWLVNAKVKLTLKILLLVWTIVLVSCEIMKIIFSHGYNWHWPAGIPLEFCSTFWLFFIVFTIYIYIYIYKDKNNNYYQLIIHIAIILFITLSVGLFAIPNLIYGDWTWSIYYQFKNGLPTDPVPTHFWYWVFFACYSICYHLISLLIVGLLIINNRVIIKWKTIFLGIIYYALWNAIVCIVAFSIKFNYMNFIEPFFLPQSMWNQWYTGVMIYFMWLIGITAFLSLGTLVSNKLINKRVLYAKKP
jgi:hypothetical protein